MTELRLEKLRLDALRTWCYILVSCYAIAAPTMILRLVTRYQRSRVRWSDSIALLALISSTLYFVTSIKVARAEHWVYSSSFGTFPSHSAIHLHELVRVASISLAKASVVMLLFEIQPTGKLRMMLVALVCFIGLQILVEEVSVLFMCIGMPHGTWTLLDSRVVPFGSPAQCIPYQRLIVIYAALNCIVELGTFAIAIHIVSKLKVTRRQKVGLGLTFALGLLTVVASIVTSVLQFQAYTDVLKPQTHQRGLDRFGFANAWSAIEVYLCIWIAAVLPIRALLIRCYKQVTERLYKCPQDTMKATCIKCEKIFEEDSTAAVASMLEADEAFIQMKSTAFM